jgi:hypothetical protein
MSISKKQLDHYPDGTAYCFQPMRLERVGLPSGGPSRGPRASLGSLHSGMLKPLPWLAGGRGLPERAP